LCVESESREREFVTAERKLTMSNVLSIPAGFPSKNFPSIAPVIVMPRRKARRKSLSFSAQVAEYYRQFLRAQAKQTAKVVEFRMPVYRHPKGMARDGVFGQGELFVA
jgi:hypothetical protein